MYELTSTDFNVVLIVLRVLFGLTFAAHGYGKRFRGGKIPGTAGWFDSIGMRPGKVHAELASLTEIAAGIGLALGFLTPFAAAAAVGVMVVAGYTVHRGKFFIASNGWEYNFVIALVAISIAGLGPGKWSIDHWLGLTDHLVGLTGAAIALGIGLIAGVGQLLAFYRPPKEAS